MIFNLIICKYNSITINNEILTFIYKI